MVFFLFRKKARHPALLLVLEHFPEYLLASKGTAPGVFLFWSPVIFLSMSPVKARAQEERVASSAGEARYSTSAATSSARFTSSAFETMTGGAARTGTCFEGSG